MTRLISFRPRPKLLGLLTGALFLTIIVGQAPHLVHHLFEPGQKQADCAFASGVERTHGLPADFVTLIPESQAETCGASADQSTLPQFALAPSDARAPPLLAS